MLKSAYKLCSALAAVILSSLLFTSCETLKNQQKEGDEIDPKELPKWTVSVNELVKYPRATPGEEEVPNFAGQSVWVRKHFEFNSKSVKDIIRIPMPDKKGYYDLKLVLDKHGSMVLMRLCNDLNRQPLAFLVDGVYYRTIDDIKTAKDDYTEVIIKGPFDEALSNFLTRYAQPNYKHFHPDEDKNSLF